MKKKLIPFVLVISLVLSMFSIVSSAEETVVEENLARKPGVTYHWSGTWEHNTQDSTAGDPGSKCFDGDINTKWGSANVSDGDQWVSVVFPSAVQISGFKVWQDNGPWTNITGFKAQIQNGSDTWQDVYTSPTYSQTWRYEEKKFDSDITATAFRIYIPAANAGGKTAVELTELVVYKLNNVTYGNGTGNTGKAYDIETANVISLTGAYAVASSTSGNIPPFAIDGVENSKWASEGNSVPQWIHIMLPEAKNVAGFKLVQDHAWTDVTAYTVEALVGDTWQTIYSSGSAIGESVTVPLESIWNIDNIRFTFTAVGQDATAGHGTTSIDFKEIVLYTAEAVAENPQTGDAGYFILLTVWLAACLVLIKSRFFGFI